MEEWVTKNTYAIAYEDFGVSRLHGILQLGQNLTALLVRPVVQDGAHEIRTGAPDGLRSEKIMGLQLDTAVGTDAPPRRSSDNLGDLLQDESSRVLRDVVTEVLQDLARAAADVDEGRGVPVGLQTLHEPRLHGIHVCPAGEVLT